MMVLGIHLLFRHHLVAPLEVSVAEQVFVAELATVLAAELQVEQARQAELPERVRQLERPEMAIVAMLAEQAGAAGQVSQVRLENLAIGRATTDFEIR